MQGPTMTEDGAAVVREDIWNDGNDQSLRAEVVVDAPDIETGKRWTYRVRVRRNAYDFQSYATCQVLTSTGWQEVSRFNEILRLPIAAHSYTSRSMDTWRADMLLTVAMVMREGRGLWEQVTR